VLSDEHLGIGLDSPRRITFEDEIERALLLGRLSRVRAEEPPDNNRSSAEVLAYLSTIPEARPKRKPRRAYREAGPPVLPANNGHDFQGPSQASPQQLPPVLLGLHRETQSLLEMVGVFPRSGVVSFNPSFAFPDQISIDVPGLIAAFHVIIAMISYS
jgi:hypothetical protein